MPRAEAAGAFPEVLEVRATRIQALRYGENPDQAAAFYGLGAYTVASGIEHLPYVVLVAIAALDGWLQVWMVFAAGVVIGHGRAFFGPALGASIPDLVRAERLVQANSALQLVNTGTGGFRSAAGGSGYSWAMWSAIIPPRDCCLPMTPSMRIMTSSRNTSTSKLK